jgi:hypothetical protein
MAEGEEARIIADEIVEYSDFMQALRTRVDEFQIQGDSFCELAGLPRGYLSKLLTFRSARRVGMQSMGPLLSAMGVKLQMVEDPAGTARLRRLPPRNPSYVRVMPAAAGITFTAKMLSRIRRLGGKARMARLTPKQRSELGRRGANARWRKDPS